jgi:hypothetical protein
VLKHGTRLDFSQQTQKSEGAQGPSNNPEEDIFPYTTPRPLAKCSFSRIMNFLELFFYGIKERHRSSKHKKIQA